jgi:hypothetical protein
MQSRRVLVLVLVFGLVFTGLAAPAVAEEEPSVLVVVAGRHILFGTPGEQFVSGQGWTPGDVIDLFINAEYVGTSTAEANAEGSASPFFDVEALGVFVAVGDEVTLVRQSDDHAVTTTVTELAVIAISVTHDTVTGIAAPGSEVLVAVCGPYCDSNESEHYVTADAGGYWVADFSSPGHGPEAVAFDIRADTIGAAMQIDGSGATALLWGPTVIDKDDCKDGGWKDYGVFKNQGQCVKSAP